MQAETQPTVPILIRGGTLVTAESTFPGDVLIVDGRIAALGSDLAQAPHAKIIDASDCMVLPGVIDAHTHIQLDTGIYQTPDDWFTGTKSAACGGVTTVIDFATQFPGQRLGEAVQDRQEQARVAAVDYALHCMVTDLPAGGEGELQELLDLGVSSIKLYTTYRPNYYAGDATILRLLEAAAGFDILTLVHCENDALVTAATQRLVAAGKVGLAHHGEARPPLAETEAVNRVLFLARAVKAPIYIVHCSVAESVRLVARARKAGQVAFAETCPQYLLLDETLYAGPEPYRYILQPPLRPAENKAALWDLIQAGAVAAVVTDSCDYSLAQKTAHDDFTQTPGGLPGVETLLPLVVSFGINGHRIDWPDLVRLLCTNPARIYGLYPKKGVLMPGSDADITIYDPRGQRTLVDDDLHGVAGYTPYAGFQLAGHVRMTLSRGRVVYEEGVFKGEAGYGAFVSRRPFQAARLARYSSDSLN